MNKPARGGRINWLNVSTVISAAILIGAEVFGGAYAGAGALALLLGAGDYVLYGIQAVFFSLAAFGIFVFIRTAQRVEPFTD